MTDTRRFFLTPFKQVREGLGLSPEARRLAEADGGIVSIPLSGGKASLNVAVAFGILMERWRSSLE